MCHYARVWFVPWLSAGSGIGGRRERGKERGIGGSVVLRLVPLCLGVKSIRRRGLLVRPHRICSILLVRVGSIRHAGVLAWVHVVLGEEGRIGTQPESLIRQERLAHLYGRRWEEETGSREGRGGEKERGNVPKERNKQKWG